MKRSLRNTTQNLEEIIAWKTLPEGGLKRMLDEIDFGEGILPEKRTLWCIFCGQYTTHKIEYCRKGDYKILARLTCTACGLVRPIYWMDFIVKGGNNK